MVDTRTKWNSTEIIRGFFAIFLIFFFFFFKRKLDMLVLLKWCFSVYHDLCIFCLDILGTIWCLKGCVGPICTVSTTYKGTGPMKMGREPCEGDSSKKGRRWNSSIPKGVRNHFSINNPRCGQRNPLPMFTGLLALLSTCGFGLVRCLVRTSCEHLRQFNKNNVAVPFIWHSCCRLPERNIGNTRKVWLMCLLVKLMIWWVL